MEKLAIIDLGSNSVRMSIFEIEKDLSFRRTSNYRSMVMLSEGMLDDMCLTPKAQLRTIKALLEYKHILETKGVTNLRAVATAAVRKAKNGAQFVASVKDVTGITIEVIDGIREAYLDCLAISKTLGVKDAVICDIGGGSSEFIALKNDKMQRDAISIPMGSRSLYEMFFSGGETPEAKARAEIFIDQKLSQISWLEKMQSTPIIGIGGTLRALSKYHANDTSAETVESHKILSCEIDTLFENISAANIFKRRQMPGIGKERADIILSGLLPLMRLKDKTSAPYLITTDVGLREGILFDFLNSGL